MSGNDIDECSTEEVTEGYRKSEECKDQSEISKKRMSRFRRKVEARRKRATTKEQDRKELVEALAELEVPEEVNKVPRSYFEGSRQRKGISSSSSSRSQRNRKIEWCHEYVGKCECDHGCTCEAEICPQVECAVLIPGEPYPEASANGSRLFSRNGHIDDMSIPDYVEEIA